MEAYSGEYFRAEYKGNQKQNIQETTTSNRHVRKWVAKSREQSSDRITDFWTE